MRLKDIGGEFSFLERIRRTSENSDVLVDNGDDGSVVRVGDSLLTVSTDTFVENDHFSFDYFTPYQVGSKAIEGSVSDIIAMGGRPKHIYLSLCLDKQIEVEVLDQIYDGIYQACKRLGCHVLGGDTTHGKQMVISVTAIGEIESEHDICRRSDAKVGDSVYITGPLGGSLAGLLLLRKKIAGHGKIERYHLEPQCRFDLVGKISGYANAMIDISDGLSSEVHHICRMSKVGAVIDESQVPLPVGIHAVADIFGANAYDYAYSGGEDFQLLYTISKDLESKAIGVKIGEITAEPSVLLLRGQETVFFENKGYDHFITS